MEQNRYKPQQGYTARHAQVQSEAGRDFTIPQPKPGKARAGISAVLAILAALMLAVAAPALWVNNLINDTDAWVAALAPLSSEPELQEVFASQASVAIKEQANAALLEGNNLPEELQPFVTSLADNVDEYIDKAVNTYVQSEQFSELWLEVCVQLHEALASDSSNTQTQDDTLLILNGAELSIDTTPLVTAIIADFDLESLASGLFEGSILEGLVSGADILAGITGGVDILAGVSGERVVLFSSPALVTFASMIPMITPVAFGSLILGLCFLVSALLVSPRRRRTLVVVCIACVITFLLAYLGLGALQAPFAAALVSPDNGLYQVFSSVYDKAISPFYSIQMICMGAFAVVALFLMLLGRVLSARKSKK